MWQCGNFYVPHVPPCYVYPAQTCTLTSVVYPSISQTSLGVHYNVLNHSASVVHQNLMQVQPMGQLSCYWTPGQYFASPFVTYINSTDYYCILCGIYILGFVHYHEHVTGKSHGKLLSRHSSQIKLLGNDNYLCNFCGMTINNHLNVRAHVINSNCQRPPNFHLSLDLETNCPWSPRDFVKITTEVMERMTISKSAHAARSHRKKRKRRYYGYNRNKKSDLEENFVEQQYPSTSSNSDCVNNARKIPTDSYLQTVNWKPLAGVIKDEPKDYCDLH